ncbi:hypothetical protein KR222_002140, partial [Zaprionus bogoriensis]
RRRDRATSQTASDTDMQGWLHKWANMVKGYQRRWFVLSNGVLSYYLDQAEIGQRSRGSIALKGAQIEDVDSSTFVVSNGDKSVTFRIKAANEAERQSWITSLELAKSAIETPKSSAVSETEQSSHVQVRRRRSRVPDKPNYPLNLWSIMKNCIGKDLSKIPMPVNFNEPLSMLQRLVENYEYAEILDVAALCTDECEQLAYLAAFTVSSYATTTVRTGKPFNPLLGETYECDRMDDLGWRCVAEQVSHHPPVSALHCEGREWVSWQEFTMTSKFRGKYCQIIPHGLAYVLFRNSGHKYSWRKVITTVHNIIVGKLWVDQHGEMEIVGSNTAQGNKCILNYIPYSYFSREVQRCVKGRVINRNNEVKWLVRGTWDEQIEIAPVLKTNGTPDNPSYVTGEYKVAWKRRLEPAESDKFYNFTTLACQLNEMEEGVAPTDCRLRPDQRLMEEGAWDESNQEKLRLEEKQRAVRRQREAEAKEAAAKGQSLPDYEPMWFTREKADGADSNHAYNNKYWEAKAAQDWRGCPDIY